MAMRPAYSPLAPLLGCRLTASKPVMVASWQGGGAEEGGGRLRGLANFQHALCVPDAPQHTTLHSRHTNTHTHTCARARTCDARSRNISA